MAEKPKKVHKKRRKSTTRKHRKSRHTKEHGGKDEPSVFFREHSPFERQPVRGPLSSPWGSLADLQDKDVTERPAGLRVGGPLTRYPVAFTADSKQMLCCSGPDALVVSCKTAQTVHRLSGHTRDVTSVLRHPDNRLQAVTCSLDGTVRCWDITDGSCLRQYDVQGPVVHACATRGPSGSCVYICQWIIAESGRKRSQLVRLDLQSGNHVVLHKHSAPSIRVAASADGLVVASVAGRSIYVWCARSHRVVAVPHSQQLTHIEFHPNDGYLATGDSTGHIVLWHGLRTLFAQSSDASSDNKPTGGNQQKNRLVTSSLHWHAHAVHSLAFSSDGGYLLSGGDEAVLVCWQLDTGHKQFLPRLGSTIRSIDISPNGSWYALGCAHNAVCLVSSVSSNVERVVRGLASAHCLTTGHTDLGIVTDAAHRLMIVGGRPGVLQLFDPFRGVQVGQVVPVHHNVVARSDRAAEIPTRVTLARVSDDGCWLGTVEHRVSREFSGTNTLRLWALNRGVRGVSFHQNTVLRSPHSTPPRTMAFCPGQPLLVTAAEEPSFKLWRLGTTAEALQPSLDKLTGRKTSERPAPASECWDCQGIGTFREGSDYNVTSAAFSDDGSFLAVAFGHVVTLWEPQSLTMKHTLLHPRPSDPLCTVAFLPNSPFLVTCSGRALYVWNLLTLSVWWSYAVLPLAVAPSPMSSHFAVAVTSKGIKPTNYSVPHAHILIFEPNSPVPQRIIPAPDLKVETRPREPPTANLAFLANKGLKPGTRHSVSELSLSLVYRTTNDELVRLPGALRETKDAADDKAAEEENLETAETKDGRVNAAVEDLRTLVQTDKRQPAAPVSTDTGAPESKAAPSAVEAVNDLLGGPVHVTPAAGNLFPQFMGSLLMPAAPSYGGSEAKAVKAAPISNRKRAAETVLTASSISPLPCKTQGPWPVDVFSAVVSEMAQISLSSSGTTSADGAEVNGAAAMDTDSPAGRSKRTRGKTPAKTAAKTPAKTPAKTKRTPRKRKAEADVPGVKATGGGPLPNGTPTMNGEHGAAHGTPKRARTRRKTSKK